MTEQPRSRSRALASVQRALLDNVTPELRAVTLDLSGDDIRVRHVYASAIGDEIREIVDDVETEMISDFFPDIAVESLIESQPVGRIATSDTEIYVYARRESADTRAVDRAFTSGSFHRALLGNVTPDLRAVTLTTGDRVHVRFIYARAIDADIHAIVDSVKTQMLADLDVGAILDATVESIPEGAIPTVEPEYYVFHRQE